MKNVTVLSVLGVLAAATALSAPPKPGTGTSKPAQAPPGSVVPVAFPDLELSRVDLNMQTKLGTMPGGQPCWSFSLQPVINNIGKAKAGPFKVVWESSDMENGRYVLACPACTENLTGAAAGAGLLPTARSFNNCGGMKWYRMRVDPDNDVHESNENNNMQKIHF